MAIILPPQSTNQTVNVGLSPNAPLGAVSGIGGAVESSAQLLANSAKQSAALGRQFFDEAKAATDTARYSSAMNEAIVRIQKAKQDRYAAQVDSDGNPTFDTLHQDVSEYGRAIAEDVTKNIKSPEVLQRFNQSFNSLMTNVQVEALSEARKQHESYIRSQVNESFKVLGDMAAKGSAVDATTGIGEYSRQLNSLVSNGAMSMEEASSNLDKFISNVSELRVLRLIEKSPDVAMAALSIDANPQVLQQEGISLTEDQRLKYSHQAQLAVNNRIRMQQATEAARLDSIKDIYKETNQLIERGGTPDPNVIQVMKNATAGTAMESSIEELQDKAQRVSIFNSLSNVEREAILNKMAASGIKDDDYVMFDRINANLKEAQSKDLYSFAISQKVIQPPKMLNLNSDLTPQLAERRRDIALIKGHYGQTPSGLTEEETKTITEHLNSLPPSEKVKKLGQIVVGLGGAATPLLSKMSKGDRVLANAGALVASGRTELATKVLTGMQFIQEQQLKLAPKFNDTVESDSRDLIPSTSNPAFYNDIITMAKGVYATKAVKDRDYSPTYNSDRWEESIKEVMGGEVLSINPKGRSFLADNYHIAPPVEGMDEEKFTKWVDSITDNEIVQLGGWAGWASGMSDQLKKASFEQAGFGRYVALIPSKLSSTGYTPVMDRSGKPFILDYQQVKDLRSGTKLPVIQDVNQDKFNFRIDDIYKAIVKKPLSQDTISKIVDEMSTKYGVPSNLVAAVIKQESDGNPKAVSGKGAIGLMQLLPGTAKDMGVTNIHDPKQNIEGGVKYLKAMLDKYKGDVPKALAAYNSGPGTVNRANGIPNIKETQQYVAKIMDSINRAN